MRIGLVTRSCPVAGADGIARQRQALGRALARRGHDVQVFTIGDRHDRRDLGGAVVHTTVRTRYPNPWFPDLPVLDWPLTDSQILWELVMREHEGAPFDVIDVPLWHAQGAALLDRPPCPVVLWLQTTLRHLIDLQGREPRPHERVLLALEAAALQRAALVLGDSHVVLDDMQRLHATPIDPHRAAVVWPGLDDVGGPWPIARPAALHGSSGTIEVLVVGRLESRKGTPELLEQLPAFLQRHGRVRVTFVGTDNSGGDGFKRATGQTYTEHFQAAHPDLADRVVFRRQVSDEQLFESYRRADILLHGARYESFGLVFVEAMRAGLPAVAFDVAGAKEIHDRDSARLVPANDWTSLLDAVAALAADAEARLACGRAARARFERMFTADTMADRTLDAYRRVVAPAGSARVAARPEPFRLFQLTEALQSPDGVGHIIQTQARLLEPHGGVVPIQTIYVQEDLAPITGRVFATPFTSSDVAMLHYYGYSRLERLMASLPCRRILHYHNITPPRYFSPLDGAYEMTTRGLAQLPRMARLADVVTGDSEFNVREFAAHLPAPRPTMCLYPLVDRHQLLDHPIDREWLASLLERKRSRGDEILIVFVGRLAPNKRQDLVVAGARRLAAGLGRPVRVALIGGGSPDAALRTQLDAIASDKSDVIVEVTGSIPTARMYAYYRAADAYLSASEHEGFGIPLVEAMAFEVPVIAAANAAVPETLGGSGILLPRWDDIAAADAVAQLVTRSAYRDEIVRGQTRNLDRFSAATLRGRLHDLAAFLRDGRPSSAIVSSDLLLSVSAS